MAVEDEGKIFVSDFRVAITHVISGWGGRGGSAFSIHYILYMVYTTDVGIIGKINIQIVVTYCDAITYNKYIP